MKHYYLLHSLRVVGLGFAVGASALASDPCSAATPVDRLHETRSSTVSYNDLDVASEPGVAALYQRLRGAASQVCGQRETRIGALHADWRNCYRSALDNAVADVNLQRLTQLHHGEESWSESSQPQVAGDPNRDSGAPSS